jgi:hypothetical protein
MALHSAEFPFLIPALAVPWQNRFQMSVSMVQFGQKLRKYGKPAGTETEVHQGHFGRARGK